MASSVKMAPKMEKQTETTRTSLRIPQKMYEKLSESANSRGLTMHADILRRLQETLELDDDEDEMTEGPFFIRLPDELYEKIAQAAERMRRSPGEQALDTLEKSYMPPKP